MASIKIKEPGEWLLLIHAYYYKRTLCDPLSFIVSHTDLQISLHRTAVLPVGGCVADGVGYVPASQHLHVSTAQETAASLSSWHPVL